MSRDMSYDEADAILAPESLATFQQRATQVLRREMVGVSPDERVAVRVNGYGRLTDIRLLDDVLRRYDNAALAELVTKTIRNAQRRAREGAKAALKELYEPVHAAAEIRKRRLEL